VNDYLDMTNAPLSNSEVEALLRGREVHDPDLAELSNFVAALRTSLDRPVAEADVAASRTLLALAARDAHGAPAEVSIAPKAKSVWMRRAAATGVAAVALGFGFAGAAAANSAAPGDALYGLDRALERVGVHNGGLSERLDEANELLAQGDEEGALALVTDALDDEGDAEGRQALLAVAARLGENGSEQSADVHAGVAAMLTWMATTEATGKEYGQGVADLARAIHADQADNPAADPSAKPDVTGAPSDPGANADGGEKPDDAGKPADPGSDGKGKPTSTPEPKGGKP
jgi:hypothetical protein